MIRHPSENFIKFLMTSSHSQLDNNDWVIMTVVSLGYPRPDSDYLAWLRGEITLRIPRNFQPNNRYHRESMRFMKDQGIYGLHNPDKAAREAHLIVTNLRVRPVIEDLLLGRMDAKDIAKKVNARFAEFYTADGIEAYRFYYWQTNLLRVEDWAKLLEEYEVQRQRTMAIVQVGPAMALHKTGFQQQIESKAMLKTMQEAMFFDFQEWRTKPHGTERTKAMSAIARTSVMVDVQMSQADSAIKESLKAFEQFRMEHAKATVKPLSEVAPSGNYTGSGARLLDKPEEVETDE